MSDVPNALWSVYVVRCADGTLYTGIARDVARRIEAHERGKGARYTRGRGPLALLGVVECASKGDALRVERAVKSLSRAEKLALVARTDALARFARGVYERAAAQRGPRKTPRAARESSRAQRKL